MGVVRTFCVNSSCRFSVLDLRNCGFRPNDWNGLFNASVVDLNVFFQYADVALMVSIGPRFHTGGVLLPPPRSRLKSTAFPPSNPEQPPVAACHAFFQRYATSSLTTSLTPTKAWSSGWKPCGCRSIQGGVNAVPCDRGTAQNSKSRSGSTDCNDSPIVQCAIDDGSECRDKRHSLVALFTR